jgi:hypothetical protein
VLTGSGQTSTAASDDESQEPDEARRGVCSRPTIQTSRTMAVVPGKHGGLAAVIGMLAAVFVATVSQSAWSYVLRGRPEALVGAFELKFERGALGVARLGDDHVGESGLGVLVVAVGAVEQDDGVGVLLQGAGVA